MKMKGRRQLSEAERMEHLQALEMLGHLIVRSATMPSVSKQFVVFSSR